MSGSATRQTGMPRVLKFAAWAFVALGGLAALLGYDAVGVFNNGKGVGIFRCR